MTFDQWFDLQFPKNLDFGFKSDMENAWEAGYFQSAEESSEGIIRLNKTITTLRNLRIKHPERTIEDDL